MDNKVAEKSMNRNNIHPIFDRMVTRENREAFLNQRPKVLWLTGLSGSGKSTIAIALEKVLFDLGYFAQILDGDNIRSGINNNLGFTEEDRIENIRRISEISKLYLNSGIIVINSFISPTIAIRNNAKEIIGENDFIEVYINTPLNICEKRDVKGLYKKARKGEIKNFTGIDAPYEAPIDPAIEIETLDKSVEECVEEICIKILPIISKDITNNQLISIAKIAALRAGKTIMNIYNSDDFEIAFKADESPLTIADKKANDIIVDILKQTNIPVLSEEGADIPFKERIKWERYWLIDPLDGTKEFIKRNGEFTVNIALIENGIPIGGVVYVPVTSELFWSSKGNGSFKKDAKSNYIQLHRKEVNDKNPIIIASRSHINQQTKDFIDQYPNATSVSCGSSLKFLLLAENKADYYPRFAPTMEWDSGAAHAILRESGGQVINWETKEPLNYNKENLLNPYFLAY